MSYKLLNLREIIEVKKGQYITKKSSVKGPYPVILGGREPAYYINRFNHTGKAIVVSRSGASAGYVSFWNEPIFVTDGFLIEPKESVNIDFLYYLMKSHESQFIGLQGGSAIPHVTPKTICAVSVLIPSLEVQTKIANMLRAYDSLIENNQKQIKLLEEAAQRLYKEWFVDLRFPGYENTKVVDGVPEGWKKGILGDIAIFRRGKTITKTQVHKGDVPVVAGGLEPAYYHNEANTVAPVITVSGSGANAGFSRLYNVDVFASDCSFADSETTPYLFFVYCFLKENRTTLDALQKGAAQPHVYAKDINAMKLTVPTDDKLEAFCKFVFSYFEKIKVLQKQIQISSQARDRLLPKFINGELEV